VDKDRIRPIAICLFRNDDRILISEAFDSSKRYYYCRPPLDGAIEYGERSRDAMMQEIKEEIDVEIKNLKSVAVLESIFCYEGYQGREIVFVYVAEFADENLYRKNEIDGYEAGIDVRFTAKWYSLEEMKKNSLRFVPEGLADLLAE
jgi:ADP-ribose pyrophosphatase YjhB (NUDIX family)